MKESKFIKTFINDNKLSKQQRIRLLDLISKEYSENLESYYELLNYLKNNSKVEPTIIEEKLKKEGLLYKNEENDLPDYINPINLSAFLNAYNQNPILKTTCHLIDSNELNNILKLTNQTTYSLEKHKSKIRNEYYKLTAKTFKGKVFKGTSTMIGEYLNNFIKDPDKKGWSKDRIPITWNSPEVIEWADKNPGKPPNPDFGIGNSFKIKRLKLSSGEFLRDFSEVVLHFKKQIQFRIGHSVKDMVREVNFKYRKDAEFDLSNIRENIQLFTDTEKVRQAYNAIIKMSIEYYKDTDKDRNDKSKFAIGFSEEGDKIKLTINHSNSIFGKTVRDLKMRYGKDFTNLIKSQINGVCDLVLKADFAGEYAEVGVWPKLEPKPIPKFEGVQFELIFFRST